MSLVPPLRPTDEFDYANARYLAVACSLLVRGSLEQVTLAMKRVLGLSGTAVAEGRTRGFVGGTSDHIIVAMGILSAKGTANEELLKELRAYDENRSVEHLAFGADFPTPERGSRFSVVATSKLQAIWPKLIPHIHREYDRLRRPIWLTGHGGGGTIASLAAGHVHQAPFHTCRVFSFGSPTIGDLNAENVLNHLPRSHVIRFTVPEDRIVLWESHEFQPYTRSGLGDVVLLPPDKETFVAFEQLKKCFGKRSVQANRS